MTFAAAILELGIMKFEDRLLRWTVAFCKWRNRPIYAAMVMVFNKFPGMAQDFIEQTAEHVLHGRDESSVTSVGGWNQDEINMAARLLVEIATNALENSNG